MDDTIKMDKNNNIKKVMNKKVGLLTSSHSYDLSGTHGRMIFGKDNNKFIGCRRKFRWEKTVRIGQ